MSGRLKHSFQGQLRAMQVSTVQVFIYIEGYTDRHFYSKLSARALSPSRASFQIVTTEEIAEALNGKEPLLRFFDYLRKKGSLVHNWKGKSTLAIFFVDKDIDDTKRTQRRSPHLVYTEFYEMENYYFKHGDIAGAAAAAASLGETEVRSAIGDYVIWRRRAAEEWAEWTTMCFFAAARDLSCRCHYRCATSLINNGAYGGVDARQRDLCYADLQQKSRLNKSLFELAYEKTDRKIKSLLRTNRHDVVFKGKWYMRFLVEDIRRIAGHRRCNSQHLESRLTSALAYGLDYTAAWCDHFCDPLRTLIRLL